MKELTRDFKNTMSSIDEEVIHQEEWLMISFNSSVPFIRAVWSGFPRDAQFRSMTTHVADVVKQKSEAHADVNCIFDISNLLVMSYTDMEWASGEGDMLLYKGGARKLAFIVLDSQFDKFYMDSYQYQAERKSYNLLQRKIFKTEGEAIDWLREAE